MDQRLTFITLGVRDLPAMTSFYKNIFEWTPMKEMEGITFFNLNGIVLALFPTSALKEDAGIDTSTEGWKQMSFSINFSSAAAVDHEIDRLRALGVNVIKSPQDVFWGGYHAYIEDPEHNLWELAFNPFLDMDEKGYVQGHQ